jgi:Tfp pilus assembly protein PilF
VVFLEQGKASQALAYLDKALEFDPEHEQALLNSAILLQELGRAELRKVARERLLKLLRKVSDAIKIKLVEFGVHIEDTMTSTI